MIRVKGAKEIKPKFLPTAIIFEGLKPITKEITKKLRKQLKGANQFYRKYVL